MIRRKHFLRIMPATVEESQAKMNKFSAPARFRRRKNRALVLATAAAAFLCGAGCLFAGRASAQTNPFRAVTDWMGMTTEAGEAPDFVRQTRPDLDHTDYSHLTGVDKKRVPVRTPAEVEADKAELTAERDKSAERMKKLGAEKVDPVAPTKAPPMTDEHF